MEASNPVADESVAAILRSAKAALLMERVAADFNELPMVAPARRIMIVAETLVRVGAENETIQNLIGATRTMEHLRAEGRRRLGGEAVMPKAFAQDFDRVTAREGAHV